MLYHARLTGCRTAPRCILATDAAAAWFSRRPANPDFLLTPAAVAHAIIPPMLARFATLSPLLAPRSVAILGASNDPTRIGGRPMAYMLAQKFAGAIYPVNPNRAEVQGLKAYASVADLPETPDVAIVAVPAELAVQAVEDLAKRGTKGALMFTAGFAEVDDAGEAEQDAHGGDRAGARHAHPGPELPRACSTRAPATTRRSRRRSTAAGRCWGASASPASPAPTARISTRWRATAASAPRSAS